ncbi:hypothetical protein SDC9_88392 [bioreactor metagenome]|uniref:Uncharacterized protein n=1 Tax=bioreactor metagenome TaxID=1076179 RepID=A0A644ZSW6_9ZZZZ
MTHSSLLLDCVSLPLVFFAKTDILILTWDAVSVLITGIHKYLIVPRVFYLVNIKVHEITEILRVFS